MPTIDKIHEVVQTMAGLLGEAKYKHASDIWGVLLAEVVMPAMADISPEVKESSSYKLIVNSKAFKEKKAFIERVLKGEASPKKYNYTSKSPYPGRRIKGTIKKESRLKRKLNKYDRDFIIQWWNKYQTLVPKEDPQCKFIADKLNKFQPELEPLAPIQVGGFFSHLCRLGLSTMEEREAGIKRMFDRGDTSVVPHYSPELEEMIRNNWEDERKESSIRRKEHAEILEARKTGVASKTPEPSKEEAPEEEWSFTAEDFEGFASGKTEKPTETFDIKFM